METRIPTNQFSSEEEKSGVSDIVFDALSKGLFEKVVFLNRPANVNSGGGTSSTSEFNSELRVQDTSRGRFLSPSRRARFRCVFYTDYASAEAYVLNLARLQSTTFGGPHTNLNFLHSFYGIKILGGQLSLVSLSGGELTEKQTDIFLEGTTTTKLETVFERTYANFYIDDRYVGSISVDLEQDIDNVITMYSILAPIRSLDGNNVNMNLENYQFIQEQ